MTPEEEALTQRWVDTWKRAGPELERIREEDVRRANTIRAFNIFKGLALLSIRDRPPGPTSGLVEQQRWFRMAAGRQETPSE